MGQVSVEIRSDPMHVFCRDQDPPYSPPQRRLASILKKCKYLELGAPQHLHATWLERGDLPRRQHRIPPALKCCAIRHIYMSGMPSQVISASTPAHMSSSPRWDVISPICDTTHKDTSLVRVFVLRAHLNGRRAWPRQAGSASPRSSDPCPGVGVLQYTLWQKLGRWVVPHY